MSHATLSYIRDLILRYGWNATAYQILNPGIEHWLAPGRDAVVGYVRRGRRWIVAGAPVCDAPSLGPEAGAFEYAARRHDARVCYFGAADRLRDTLAGSGRHATVALGAQPVWDPHGWPQRVRGHASLRAQLNRAANKDVVVEKWSAPRGRCSPALRGCLSQWLSRRPLPPMHFLVEPNTLDALFADRLLYVATRNHRPVGFLIASPIASRNGYLIEQIVRGHSAPNGAAEAMIDACMRDLASRGITYVTQGLVALSPHAREAMANNPLWLRALMGWAALHGKRFYNFEGLERFRAKMEPDRWETIYAIANEPRFSPTTVHAIASAFCAGSPLTALARGMARALRQEIDWLKARGA